MPERKPHPKNRRPKSKAKPKTSAGRKPAAKEAERLEIPVLDTNGKTAERLPLAGVIAELETHPHLIYQAATAALANRRLGTVKTKSRGEVSGSGKKPWRQKGTGRARAGSIRSPLWRKGGTVFGPVARDFRIDLPRRIKTLALAAGLRNKAKEGRLFMIENFLFKEGKTGDAARFLAKMPATKSIVISSEADPGTLRAVRNLPDTRLFSSGQVSAHDVFGANECFVTRQGYDRLVKRLKEGEA